MIWTSEEQMYFELKYYLKKLKLEEHFLQVSEKVHQWSFNLVLKNIFENNEDNSASLFGWLGTRNFVKVMWEEKNWRAF